MAVTSTTEQQHSEQQREAIAPERPVSFDFDVVLVLAVAALLAVGLLMVYSTTFDWSYLAYGSPVRIFLNQLRSAIIGVAVMLLVWRMDYRVLRDWGYLIPRTMTERGGKPSSFTERLVILIRSTLPSPATLIMFATIAVLALLLITNQSQDFGSRRALYQGSFQPGEAAKLALIIYFGQWLTRRRRPDAMEYKMHTPLGWDMVTFSILVGGVGGLIVLEPDLSTAAVLVLTAWTMFFLAGAKVAQFAIAGVGVAGVGAVLAWQLEYARQRLIEHLATMQDLTQASWHVQQAIIAFTAPGDRPGGSFSPNWFGVGLGQSRQKFGFLPAPHTDSIFAIVGEELGLFGCLVVITLFVLFVWRGFRIAREAQHPFGALLAGGIAAWIAYEALLNIAVVTAVIPFTGVALPFISYGGSNLVVVLTGVGLLMSISRRRPLSMEKRETNADYDFGRGDRRRGVSRVSRRGGIEE